MRLATLNRRGEESCSVDITFELRSKEGVIQASICHRSFQEEELSVHS